MFRVFVIAFTIGLWVMNTGCHATKPLSLPNFERDKWVADSEGDTGYRKRYMDSDTNILNIIKRLSKKQILAQLGKDNTLLVVSKEDRFYSFYKKKHRCCLYLKYFITKPIYSSGAKYFVLTISFRRQKVRIVEYYERLCDDGFEG